MCGICGIYRYRAGAAAPDPDELRRIREAMAARGPDGRGDWRSEEGSVLLGHRRLAILDLSPAGAQPMASADGRYRIVYNGEIYNFRELRRELQRDGERFRSESDTEVILALWARDKEKGLARLRGMYALAIWDRAERSLALARDPFGIKPLYYSIAGGLVRFASQVRALDAGGGLSREVDPTGLGGFLLWGSVPEPWTIRREIRALPAGHLVVFGEGALGEPRRMVGVPEADGEGDADPAEALEASVRAHLVSDVPVAVFLSAGLDSAIVAALAARSLPEPPTTFTVGFEGWEGSARDEGPLAREVAASIGARHVERRLGRTEVAALWPKAVAAMDQPSIDGFNTFVVARAAHEAGIKVALSGLGGDELLGSYPSFRDVPRWSARARRLRWLAKVPAVWSAVASSAFPSRPKLRGLIRYGQSINGSYFLRRGMFLPEELSAILGADLAHEALAAFDPVAHAGSALAQAPPYAPCRPERSEGPRETAAESPPGDPWRQVQRLESTLYLRNQLLRDSDWAAMASSLELRVPMVDVPLWKQLERNDFEPARSRGKAVALRAVANRLAPGLPEELWSRPKTGFAVPVAEWMFPPKAGEKDRPGLGSRRIALRLLEELGLCER